MNSVRRLCSDFDGREYYGRVIALENEELHKTEGRAEPRYIEIPCTSHSELHELLDEFVWSLDNREAKRAGEEKYGIGETPRALDEYMNGTSDFSVFVARKWLASIGIEIAGQNH